MTHQPSPQFYFPKYGQFLSPEAKLYRDMQAEAKKQEERNANHNDTHQ